jgi:hypothetical protein
MRRVIGIDIHRTFGEVVIWESGLTRHAGRVELMRWMPPPSGISYAMMVLREPIGGRTHDDED